MMIIDDDDGDGDVGYDVFVVIVMIFYIIYKYLHRLCSSDLFEDKVPTVLCCFLYR